MEKIIVLVALLVLLSVSAQAATETLEAEVIIDWKDKNNFSIDVEGGDFADFNCQLVRNSSTNYRDFDTVLDAEVRFEGETYDTEIEVDWRSNHEFRVRSEETQEDFNCDDVTSTNFNDRDEEFTMEFIVNTPSNERDDIEEIIALYVNRTESIESLNVRLAESEKDRDNFKQDWQTCEQESGEIKGEIKDLRQENDDLQSLQTDVSVKESELKSCENQKTGLSQQLTATKEDLDDLKGKDGGVLIWAALASFVTWLIMKVTKPKNPDEDVEYTENPKEYNYTNEF